MGEFTCSACDMTYEKPNDEQWNDFKAADELLTLYPESKNDPTNILCDDCNKQFQKWFATLTEEQKRKMREDYHAQGKCMDKR
ncbi:MAG TPA: hypothetical protein VJ279_08605 [Hanamia sp.]|jgi:hypothetical protein|nr:hypothetical protein [Hanamia sp.]